MARLAMTEQILDDMKRMLELFRQTPQFIVGQRLAFGTFHGHVPGHGFACVLRPLLHALATGVAERCDQRRVDDGPRCLRPTNRSIVAPHTCAACVPSRLADDPRPRPSDRTARRVCGACPTASRCRSRRGSGRAACAFSWRSIMAFVSGPSIREVRWLAAGMVMLYRQL